MASSKQKIEYPHSILRVWFKPDEKNRYDHDGVQDIIETTLARDKVELEKYIQGKYPNFREYKVFYDGRSALKYCYEERVCRVCGCTYRWIDDLIKNGEIRYKYYGKIDLCDDCYSRTTNKHVETLAKEKVDLYLSKIYEYGEWLDDEPAGSRYFIYFISNKEKNIGYVGQTKKHIAFRFNQHIQKWIGNPTGWRFEVLEYWQKESDNDDVLDIEAHYIELKTKEGWDMRNIMRPKDKRISKEEIIDKLFEEVKNV